jgi:uncharacterized alpha-E superfamily protein
VDDSFCDPLELRGDSFLGVSGLLEAARAGNVTVANALGAGLMESPAFLAFLPNLCRHLLGEQLLMPSLATWWCGQAEALRYVIQNLDSLVVRHAFDPRRPAPSPLSGTPRSRRKAAEHRANLIRMIQAAPREFVAQERIKLSQAPSWLDDHLTAQSVVVRAYVANGGDLFAVLPGGLTRVSRQPDSLVISMQSGGGSKDTWILSNGASNRPDQTPVIGEPRVADFISPGVPSRAADHLFWLGRYTERLEQLLRVLRCMLGRITGESSGEGQFEYKSLAELAVNLGLVTRSATAEPENGELSQRILDLLYHSDESGGVRDLLKRIRSTASAVRDRFSGDTWRILGRLERDARSRPGRLPLAHATALMHSLVLDLAAFNGMEMENMTRGHGWRFLDLGRRLERGLSVLKLLQAMAAIESTRPVLEPVLEIADSVMTYRRRYFTAPRLAGVLDLLVRDESNPRSLIFQVNVLHEHAAALVKDSKSAAGRFDPARLQSLATAVLVVAPDELAAMSASELLLLLNSLATALADLSDDITNQFFSHSVPRMS